MHECSACLHLFLVSKLYVEWDFSHANLRLDVPKKGRSMQQSYVTQLIPKVCGISNPITLHLTLFTGSTTLRKERTVFEPIYIAVSHDF